jgi:peroxiredoxin Q/BCP
VLGISFDTPADNAAFVKEQGFPFRLLSDRDRTLAVAVGAAADTSQRYAQRISYLVGPDGKVMKAYSEVTPKTHAQQVLADLGSSPVAVPTSAGP